MFPKPVGFLGIWERAHGWPLDHQAQITCHMMITLDRLIAQPSLQVHRQQVYLVRVHERPGAVTKPLEKQRRPSGQ